MATKFTCTSYPFLRVLVERSGNPIGGDKFAEFQYGNFETDDPKTIAVLRLTPFVHEDTTIDMAHVPVDVNEDKPQAQEVKSKLKAR